MGRLSAYAKNRILKLRFKKNKRIIHIVDILKKDDNIKVSRQAVSTFLKKYLETNSIYDKPRTGRKRKLTQEEIQLIGQVTRLNRDITARAIKEYLNLNVSTYTILRATKLFEWNKINPNSNDSKKAAALERQLNGDSVGKRKSSVSSKRSKRKSTNSESECMQSESENNQSSDAIKQPNEQAPTAAAPANETIDQLSTSASNAQLEITSNSNQPVPTKRHTANSIPDIEKVDLNLISHRELAILKNLSCSPMSFATKILFKIFKIEELHGHNVSGKTLNKNLKAKLPLDPVRIGYIKFLVEKYYDEKECKEMLSSATHKQDLWKSCHTAINKSILISERKAAAAVAAGKPITNPNDSFNLTDVHMNSNNSSTMDEDNSSRHGGDETSTDDSDSEDFSKELAKAAELSKKKLLSKKKSARRGRVGRPPKRPLNSKRYSKYKSDDSSDSSDFDDDLISEDYDTDMDTSGPGNISHNQDEEEGYQNEIELIQNIENRLTNAKQTSKVNNGIESTSKIASPSQTTTEVKASKGQRQKNVSNTVLNSNKSPKVSKIKEEDIYEYNEGEQIASSESSAAANIAAAMKKRLVVVASVNPNVNDAVSENASAPKEAATSNDSTTPKSVGRPPMNKQKQTAKKTQEKPKEKEKPASKQSKTQVSPKKVEEKQVDQSMNDSTESTSNRRQQPLRANKLKKYNG